MTKAVLVRASGCIEMMADEVADEMIRDGRAFAFPPKPEEMAEIQAGLAAGTVVPPVQTAAVEPVKETGVQAHVPSSKTALRRMMSK